jgi:hypothetical protein
MEGLFFSFILFDPPGVMFGVESALLLKNAEECQDNFRKSSVNCRWREPDEKEMMKHESRMTNSFRSATAGLWSAMRRSRWRVRRARAGHTSQIMQAMLFAS